jgi:hypothetical protein
MEQILAKGEEHADDMKKLLETLSKDERFAEQSLRNFILLRQQGRPAKTTDPHSRCPKTVLDVYSAERSLLQ